MLLDGRGHGVELRRERPQLVARVDGDAAVEVAGREAGGALAEPRQRPRDGAADGEGDGGGQDRRPHEQRHQPAVRAPLHGARLGARGRDALLEVGDELLRAILNPRHHELRARVLGLDEPSIAAHDGRHDALPEEDVELGAGPLDVLHPGALVLAARPRPQRARELEDVPLGLGVEAEVALVPDDDGVRLVRVLVAHRARELEREPDALLLVLDARDRVADAVEPGDGEVGRDGEGDDERAEAEEELAGRSGPVREALAGHAGRCSKGRARLAIGRPSRRNGLARGGGRIDV